MKVSHSPRADCWESSHRQTGPAESGAVCRKRVACQDRPAEHGSPLPGHDGPEPRELPNSNRHDSDVDSWHAACRTVSPAPLPFDGLYLAVRTGQSWPPGKTRITVLAAYTDCDFKQKLVRHGQQATYVFSEIHSSPKLSVSDNLMVQALK